jgi:hypothetical protein
MRNKGGNHASIFNKFNLLHILGVSQKVDNFETALNFTNRSCHEIFDKYRLFAHLLQLIM